MPDRSESSTVTIFNNTRLILTLKSAEEIEGYSIGRIIGLSSGGGNNRSRRENRSI
jgi:hypothetical protein